MTNLCRDVIKQNVTLPSQHMQKEIVFEFLKWVALPFKMKPAPLSYYLFQAPKVQLVFEVLQIFGMLNGITWPLISPPLLATLGTDRATTVAVLRGH